jgi:hypothetical protein
VASDGHIFLYGRALGGCVATYMATHTDTPTHLFSGVILENTFTSISDIVDYIFPLFIQVAKPYILNIDWDTLSIVPSIRLPVLYIHRDEDESVPREMTEKLYEATINAPIRNKFIITAEQD